MPYLNLYNSISACNTYSTVTDCQDVQSVGFNDSGVYHVTPPGTFQGVDVYCDMVTDGGGWIVSLPIYLSTCCFNRFQSDIQNSLCYTLE